jgi:hypothetical protein
VEGRCLLVRPPSGQLRLHCGPLVGPIPHVAIISGKGRVGEVQRGRPETSFAGAEALAATKCMLFPFDDFHVPFEGCRLGSIMAPPDAKAVKAIIRAHRPKFRRELLRCETCKCPMSLPVQMSSYCFDAAGPRLRSSHLQCMPSSWLRATSRLPWENVQMKLVQVNTGTCNIVH